MYSVEGLTHGIQRSKHNIEVLKKAIQDEEKTIVEYRAMIQRLEEVEAERIEAESHVEIVRDNSE
jgi:hypothetical protein